MEKEVWDPGPREVTSATFEERNYLMMMIVQTRVSSRKRDAVQPATWFLCFIQAITCISSPDGITQGLTDFLQRVR